MFAVSRYFDHIFRSDGLTNVRHISYKAIKTWYSNLTEPKENSPPYDHIVQIGDPTLRTVSEVVPEEYIKSSEIQFLIRKMKHVFKKYNCVGLSAPQIGYGLRIIMFEYNKNHAKCFTDQEQKNMQIKLHPFTVVVNPVIKITDFSRVILPELCESIRGFSAEVPRYNALVLKGLGEDGNSVQLDLDGWNARIIQHEVDHLNGVLYTDIMDKKSLKCSCWEVVNLRRGKVELPYGAS